MTTLTPSRTQMVEHHEAMIRQHDDQAQMCRNAAWAFEAIADKIKDLPMGPGYWTQAVEHMSEVATARAGKLFEQQAKAETEATRLRTEGVPY